MFCVWLEKSRFGRTYRISQHLMDYSADSLVTRHHEQSRLGIGRFSQGTSRTSYWIPFSRLYFVYGLQRV